MQAAQLTNDLPDLTVADEVDQIMSGLGVPVSPTTAALLSGRAKLIIRDNANDLDEGWDDCDAYD